MFQLVDICNSTQSIFILQLVSIRSRIFKLNGNNHFADSFWFYSAMYDVHSIAHTEFIYPTKRGLRVHCCVALRIIRIRMQDRLFDYHVKYEK